MNRRTLLGGAAAMLTAGCMPSLSSFNRFAPHDGDARVALKNAPYGVAPGQTLDVYAPRATTSIKPVIVFIHGGSWASGDKDEYGFMGDAFASQDYVVVIPNYRLVPNVRFPGFIDDCALAMRWVQDNIAEHGGDPRRIVIVGHSAGAYIGAMLALDAHYLRDADFDTAPLRGLDRPALRGFAGLAGPYNFLPLDVDATRNAFGQAPNLDLTQPIHFARANAAPLWLAWGEKDTTVGRRNIEGLASAMRAAGGAVETKIYPNLSHVGIMLALSRPFRGNAPVLGDVIAFVERCTN